MPSEADSPLQTATLHVAGYTLHYAFSRPPAPALPPIVALHGFGTTGFRTFRHVAGLLAAAGMPVFAPDLLGFGGSDKPDDFVYSLEHHAALTAAFAGALQLDRPVLLGHSMGGKIVAAAAALHPDRFAGVVLVNPGGFTPVARLSAYLAEARWVQHLFAQDWFYRGLLPRTPLGAVFQTEENRAELARLRRSHHALDLDATGLRPRLRTVRAPVLLIWGNRDRILPRSTVRHVRRTFPHVRVAEIEGAGHAPMKDAPAAFARAVEVFTRGVASAAG